MRLSMITTLVGSKLLERDIIDIDINQDALQRRREKTDFGYENGGKVYNHQGDGKNLNFLPDGNIDFRCTYPSYTNIIQYNEDIAGDLSHHDETMLYIGPEMLLIVRLNTQ